jgi:hypothetical protein
MAGRIGGPPAAGADRVLHAAVSEAPTGSYLEDDRVSRPSADVLDPGIRRGLATLLTARLAPVARREAGSPA